MVLFAGISQATAGKASLPVNGIKEIFKSTFDRREFTVQNLINGIRYTHHAVQGDVAVDLTEVVERAGKSGGINTQVNFSYGAPYKGGAGDPLNGKKCGELANEVLNNAFQKYGVKTIDGKFLTARAFTSDNMNLVLIDLSRLDQRAVLGVKDLLKAIVYIYDENGIAGFRMALQSGIRADQIKW